MEQKLEFPEPAKQRPAFYTIDSSATVVPNDKTNKFENFFALDLESRLGKASKEKADEFDETTTDLDAELKTAYNSDAEEDPTTNGSSDFPEGSLKSYLVVLGSFMGLIPCFGFFNIQGVLESYINENQLSEVDPSSVGWIFSLSTFITYTMCIFSGTYFDRSGARAPLITGAVLFVAGAIATADCRTMFQFVMALSLMISIGNGILMAPLISVISHYFYAKRGLFVSVATLGGGLGGCAFPLMFRALFPKVGFVWAMRIFALISAVCLSFSVALTRERKECLPTEKQVKYTVTQNVKQYFESFDFKSLKDTKFLLFIAGSVFAEISVLSTITYFASYARMRGFTVDDSFLLVTISNLGTLPGRLVTGYLADKFGRFNIFISTILMTAMVNLCIWLPFGSNQIILYAYAVLYGLFSGAVFSLLAVCVGQICKTEDFGKRFSTMYFIIAFFVLIGVPISGAIIGDKSIERYNYFIIFTACCSILSASCYSVSRYFCVGGKILVIF